VLRAHEFITAARIVKTTQVRQRGAELSQTSRNRHPGAARERSERS
jgi:hypothetical protein